MNMLMGEEELTIDEYTVTFSDPQSYTLIQIKADRFTWLALARRTGDAAGPDPGVVPPALESLGVPRGGGRLDGFGESRKGGALFRERFGTRRIRRSDRRRRPHASG